MTYEKDIKTREVLHNKKLQALMLGVISGRLTIYCFEIVNNFLSHFERLGNVVLSCNPQFMCQWKVSWQQ